jgi:hypothetical protein
MNFVHRPTKLSGCSNSLVRSPQHHSLTRLRDQTNIRTNPESTTGLIHPPLNPLTAEMNPAFGIWRAHLVGYRANSNSPSNHSNKLQSLPLVLTGPVASHTRFILRWFQRVRNGSRVASNVLLNVGCNSIKSC